MPPNFFYRYIKFTFIPQSCCIFEGSQTSVSFLLEVFSVLFVFLCDSLGHSSPHCVSRSLLARDYLLHCNLAHLYSLFSCPPLLYQSLFPFMIPRHVIWASSSAGKPTFPGLADAYANAESSGLPKDWTRVHYHLSVLTQAIEGAATTLVDVI